MGFFTSYDLRGWGPDGRFLSASEKEEIQDFVFDEGVEDCGCSHFDRDEHIVSFCDTSFHAYDNVTNALRDYAGRHPNMLLELEFSSEAEDHQLIRFKGDDTEAIERVEFFPPFRRLTRREDDNSLPTATNGRTISEEQALKLIEVLADNGVERDECITVAEAICYVLDLDESIVLDLDKGVSARPVSQS